MNKIEDLVDILYPTKTDNTKIGTPTNKQNSAPKLGMSWGRYIPNKTQTPKSNIVAKQPTKKNTIPLDTTERIEETFIQDVYMDVFSKKRK